MKLKPVVDTTGALLGYAFRCPGCEHTHVFWTAPPLAGSTKPTWTFDGNMEAPTFAPSLKNEAPNHSDPRQRCCHLNLTAGRVHYANDCTHPLVNTIVDLPEYAP